MGGRPQSSAGQRSLPPAGGSAERLYALTGRSATNTGFGSTNSQRAKAALALTFNRRDNERRHELYVHHSSPPTATTDWIDLTD